MCVGGLKDAIKLPKLNQKHYAMGENRNLSYYEAPYYYILPININCYSIFLFVNLSRKS